jgi:hypothetical protein
MQLPHIVKLSRTPDLLRQISEAHNAGANLASKVPEGVARTQEPRPGWLICLQIFPADYVATALFRY